jgi:DNA-directed RNA polymerase subunit H (RpoH/RPB5)
MSSITKAKTLEEKRAALIIKYRNLTIDSREKDEGKIVFHLSRGENKFLMHILLGKSTIGIAYLRELRNELEKNNATSGIIVGDGKYTYSARSSASKLNLELIPKTLPTFDVFEHQLVPLHTIVSKEEKEELKKRYHAEPYRFPWIKASDPISIILGAKPGDVLKITQKSETAGKYNSYRYVV